MIVAHAPMVWAHVNMLGEHDFPDERLRDAPGILPLKPAASHGRIREEQIRNCPVRSGFHPKWHVASCTFVGKNPKASKSARF